MLIKILTLILVLSLAACNGKDAGQLEEGLGLTTSGTGSGALPGPGGTTVPSGPKFLTLFSGNNQNVGVGLTAALPLSVLAQDANGNPVVGATVSFQFINASMGSLSQYVVNTNAQGLATTNFTASGAVGAVSLVAISPFGTINFDLTNLGPSTYTLSQVAGSGQAGLILSNLGNSMRVLVTNGGSPVQGVKVKFQSIGSKQGTFNNNLPSAEVFTNSSGIADSGYFRLGELSGLYSINAQMVGDTGQVENFTATATLPVNQAISNVNTTLAASHATRIADGVNTVLYTLTLKDLYGNTLNKSLSDVAIVFTPSQSFGCDFAQSWIQVSPGVFTKSVRVGVAEGNISYSLTLDGAAMFSSLPTLNLAAVQIIDLAQTTITSNVSSLTADGVSLALITVKLRNSLGQVIDDPNFLSTGGNSISVSASLGTYVQAGVTYNAGGTFDIALRAPNSVGIGNTLLSTTVSTGGSNVTKTLSIPLTGGTLDVGASGIYPPATFTSAWGAPGAMSIPVYLKDAQNNSVDLTGATVTVTRAQSNGTYTSVISTVSKVGVGSYLVTLTPPASCPSSPCLDTLTATITHASINSGASTQLGSQKVIYHAGTSVIPSTVNSTFALVAANYAEAINGLGVQFLVTMKNASNVQIPVGGFGGNLSFDTSNAFTKSVVDNQNGTYLVTIGAPTTPIADSVMAKYSGTQFGTTKPFYFYGAPVIANSIFSFTPSNLNTAYLDGAASINVRMYLRDSIAQYIPVSALNTSDVTFSIASGLGGFSSAVLKNTDATGVYFERTFQRTDTPMITFENTIINATIPGWGASKSVTAIIKPKNLGGITIDCSNIASYKGKYLYVSSGTLTISTWWNGGRSNLAGCAAADAFDFYGLKIGSAGIVTSPWGDQNNTYGIDINLLTEGIEIELGGKIDVSGKGYRGGFCPAGTVNAATEGFNPRTVGGSVTIKNFSLSAGDFNGGGSFGSLGTFSRNSYDVSPTTNFPLLLYGNMKNVNHPGSGGSVYGNNAASPTYCMTYFGGSGGGLVRLTANKALINGNIISRSASPVGNMGHPGSGGGVHIELTDPSNKLNGDGLIDVSSFISGSSGASGGGGRISILGELGTFNLKNFLLNASPIYYEHRPGTLYISQPISGAHELLYSLNLGLKGIGNRSEITFGPTAELTLKSGAFLVTDMPIILKKLVLESGSILTHNSTQNGLTNLADVPKLPRVDIEAEYIEVKAGAIINVDRKGYPGGGNPTLNAAADLSCGQGPIDPLNPELGYNCHITSSVYSNLTKTAYPTFVGNSYGGSHYKGGSCQYLTANPANNNITWGNPLDPDSPGGGGYLATVNYTYYTHNYASGGGIIRLKSNQMIINGVISSHGGNNSYGGGGGAAGGSIKIDADDISIMTANLIKATGGNGTWNSGYGAGAGGLVYIGYINHLGIIDPASMTSLSVTTGGAITDSGGISGTYCSRPVDRNGQTGLTTIDMHP